MTETRKSQDLSSKMTKRKLEDATSFRAPFQMKAVVSEACHHSDITGKGPRMGSANLPNTLGN